MSEREAEIRRLLPLVRRIARRVGCVIGGSDLDDLIGDGSVGLIRAVDSFDPAFGVTLDFYARRVIVGAMLNGVRRLDPVSERVRRIVREAERERYALANERGELPSQAEMDTLIPGLRRARTDAYRGAPLSIDASLPAHDAIEPVSNDDPSVAAIARSESRLLARTIAVLPRRERTLIVQHYFAGRSLRTLSGEMAVSPQRASQLHRIALDRLRLQLASSA